MTRTTYMQEIMTSTYPRIPIEAVRNGYNGAWERLIAEQLRFDTSYDHSEACEIVESVDRNFMKAAQLIINSKIPENVTNKQ